MKENKKDNSMLTRLVFRLLPVQVLIVAMGSVNSIVDGVTAARCIGAASVGVVGLYYTVVRVMEAISAVLTGGSTVLCGRYLGAGEVDKTRGVFTLDIMITVIAGTLLTAASFTAGKPIAVLLGADAGLKKELCTYIIWYASGILPQLLAQQLSGFLQLERQGKRCYIGAGVMILTNVAMNIVLVYVLGLGIMGLALSTSIANWVYFLILVSYYLKGKSKLRLFFPETWKKETKDMLQTGFPGALLVFCLALRSLVINRTLLTYAGEDGLSAMSSFNMICGLFIALSIGAGAVVRMLTIVFAGKKDPDSILSLFKVVYTKVMLLALAVGAVVFFAAPCLAGMYYADHTAPVYKMTRGLFSLYSICIPMVLICQVSTNYFQAIGRTGFVNILSVFDGFLAMVIPAVLLAPSMGAFGVWLALPAGIAATALLAPVYSMICCRKIPGSLAEWLLLPQVFPESEQYFRYSCSLHDPADVSKVSGMIQEFCETHDMKGKTAYHAALCFEEMAWNIFQHGFRADKRSHTVDLCMVIMEDSVILRIKDDCIPFDPGEFAEVTAPASSYRNIGIRLVYQIASEITYQNLIGLNALTIRTKR